MIVFVPRLINCTTQSCATIFFCQICSKASTDLLHVGTSRRLAVHLSRLAEQKRYVLVYEATLYIGRLDYYFWYTQWLPAWAAKICAMMQTWCRPSSSKEPNQWRYRLVTPLLSHSASCRHGTCVSFSVLDVSLSCADCGKFAWPLPSIFFRFRFWFSSTSRSEDFSFIW